MSTQKKRINWKKTQGIVAIVIIFSIGIYGFWQSQEEKKHLENHKETIGSVIKIYSLKSRGYYIKYTYNVENIKYNRDQKITDVNFKETISIGDQFVIIYSITNPEQSKLLFDKKLAN